ncbi:exo-alpha-sialidase [Flavihumibacter petaseus]|uniref:Sialidase domain-containing protein n=1 Tax=Flavihumibacter petaseus NBRC 106054 TaxID=1220578 RepID=A0A0E9N4B7_9BACT|nr:exo-alpha-sialidase [Flavihumibacter petaseus]GAO44669.1 hypothetical protein FPE01S_03_07080 [Flavihumibacter petaseus NBRC 106054]
MKNTILFCALAWAAVACNTGVKPDQPVPGATCISDTTRKASAVSLSTDQSAQPVISWCESDAKSTHYFYMAYADTATGGFSAPVAVPVENGVSLHEEGMPKIAIKSDGTIVAVYEVSSPTTQNEYAGAVRFIQSADKGRTWSAPQYVHADTVAGKSRSFAAITRLADGELGVCWLDAKVPGQKSGRPVKFARTNGTGGFVNEILADSTACECCRTAITCNESGKISIAYRDIISDSIRDISIVTSTDNGRTFSEPVPFSGDNWKLTGCPHNGPALVNAGNITYATWFTGGQSRGVNYAELDSSNMPRAKKHLSNNGKYSQLCVMPSGESVVAFSDLVKAGGKLQSRIVLNKISHDQTGILELTAPEIEATYPVIRPVATGKVMVAWSAQGKVYYQLVETEKISHPVTQVASVTTETPAHHHGHGE